jgi:hypothetical protein
MAGGHQTLHEAQRKAGRRRGRPARQSAAVGSAGLMGRGPAFRQRLHQPRTSRTYLWLGAGVIALGVGAAMASGSGVAHADSTHAGSTSAASASSSSPAGSATAKTKAHPKRSPTTERASVGTSPTAKTTLHPITGLTASLSGGPIRARSTHTRVDIRDVGTRPVSHTEAAASSGSPLAPSAAIRTLPVVSTLISPAAATAAALPPTVILARAC